ncbi:hypothetical protein [Parvibium lacunae]|uniref:Uncharacterized protein n=1 Tax=Parvibium lacunae TaxID=1888893 RepID=A0A368L7Q1_9BURK|nr:hypothetical protein [Parvibium lacunae]RCS59582.1 hypothetical protein DU000_02365 [Parvibium lacunae]
MKYWFFAMALFGLIEMLTLTGRFIVPIVAALVGGIAAATGAGLLGQCFFAALGGTVCLIILAMLHANDIQTSHQTEANDTVGNL